MGGGPATVPSRRAREGTPGRGSDGLLDLAGLEALRAHVGALRLALEVHANPLEVRVEAPLRGDHRMAPVITETRLLSTDCADPRHRGGMVAERPTSPGPWPGAARRDPPSRAQSSRRRRPCPLEPRPARACPRSVPRRRQARP